MYLQLVIPVSPWRTISYTVSVAELVLHICDDGAYSRVHLCFSRGPEDFTALSSQAIECGVAKGVYGAYTNGKDLV